MKYVLAAAALTAAFLIQSAAGQERTLQIDVNNLAFQARNSLGTPAPFGGLTHTGSLHMVHSLPTTEIVGVLMRTGTGPFLLQTQFTGSLSSALLHIDLNAGVVAGGMLTIDINGGPASGGDRYSATIAPGGSVEPFAGGGFQIEGLTSSGLFNDTNFGGVDIPDFFAAQGGAFLPGFYLAFKIQPNAQGAGFADTDIFVTNIPAPGALVCLAAGGLIALRRRR
jgi:hypothetical protein